MQPAESIGILRGEVSPSSGLHRLIAENMGAEALEFQEWLFDLIDHGFIRVVAMYERWHGEDSFLDYCQAEWEKERNHG